MNRLRGGHGEDRECGRAEDGLGRLVILPATVPNPGRCVVRSIGDDRTRECQNLTARDGRGIQCGDGIALMERAVGAMRVPLARISHTAIEETRSRARLSEAYLLAGNPREARDTALAALQSGEQHGHNGQVAWVHRVFGEIARLYPSFLPDSADHHYSEALRRAEDLGMRPLVAHCHLGLGKLNRGSGNRGQAKEHLSIATLMYREMGMAYWLEQAEAELRQLG